LKNARDCDPLARGSGVPFRPGYPRLSSAFPQACKATPLVQRGFQHIHFAVNIFPLNGLHRAPRGVIRIVDKIF